MCAKCFWLTRQRQAGSTLVEAIVSMAILGSLVVSIVVAAGRMTAQTGLANERIKACRLADQLLEGWWADRDSFPVQSAGIFADETLWRWRTSIVEKRNAEVLQADVVALEIFAPVKNAGVEMAAASEKATLRLEVLLPRKER